MPSPIKQKPARQVTKAQVTNLNEIRYSWTQVRDAVDRILALEFRNTSGNSIVNEIFHDGLPQAMDKAAIICFRSALRRKKPDNADVRILHNAYMQLEKHGAISAEGENNE